MSFNFRALGCPRQPTGTTWIFHELSISSIVYKMAKDYYMSFSLLVLSWFPNQSWCQICVQIDRIPQQPSVPYTETPNTARMEEMR